MIAGGADRRKVLVVSFYFPPTNKIAAVRLGKFAKYLPEFGWEPIVLTASEVKGFSQDLPVETKEASIFRTPYSALGPAVSNKLTGGQRTVHQAAPKISAWRRILYKVIRSMEPIYALPVIRILILEPIGWYRPAVKQGLEVISKEKIDVIFSSYGPSVSHIVASKLHKQTGIAWVADFRDLWSLNPYLRKVQLFHFFEKKLERRVMKGSDLLITVSEPAAKQLQALHCQKVVTIPNGFDEEDYIDKVPLTTKFTITYTGNIYPGKQTPASLFEALAELRQEHSLSPDELEVRFFGSNVLTTVAPLVEKYRVEDMVKVYGLVSFRESIQRQKESTILLHLGWNDPRERGFYTAKIFEYLGAGRPVLAMGLGGDVVDDLLEETGAGVVVSEVNEVKTLLYRWMQEFKQSGEVLSHFKPDSAAVSRYTRRQQAGRLAQVLEQTLRQRQTA
ncbi:MAG: glycosyltransferase [Dehalococcoidia bacterium]